MIRASDFCETNVQSRRRLKQWAYCTHSPLLTYTITECLSARRGFARSGPIYCHPNATNCWCPQHIGILRGIGICLSWSFKKWRICAPFLHTSFVCWWHVKNNWVSPRKVSGVMKWKSTVENSGLLGATVLDLKELPRPHPTKRICGMCTRCALLNEYTYGN